MLRKIADRSSARNISFFLPFRNKSRPTHGVHLSLMEQNASQNCRQAHGKSNSSWSSVFRDRFGEYRRNGVPEIIFGSLIIALIGVDYILQTRNDQQRETMYKQLERAVRRDEATSRMEDRRMLDEAAATTSKFKCVIRKVPLNFDGHKCLKNVKVGDVVSVIEEGVGPGGQYNLCSIERMSTKLGVSSSERDPRTSIGWFPCSCLEKV